MKINLKHITVLLLISMGSIQCVAEEPTDTQKTFSIRNNGGTQPWIFKNIPDKGHIQFIAGCDEGKVIDGPCTIQPQKTALFQLISEDDTQEECKAREDDHELHKITLGNFTFKDHNGHIMPGDVILTDSDGNITSIIHSQYNKYRARYCDYKGYIIHAAEAKTPPIRLNFRYDEKNPSEAIDENGNAIIEKDEWVQVLPPLKKSGPG